MFRIVKLQGISEKVSNRIWYENRHFYQCKCKKFFLYIFQLPSLCRLTGCLWFYSYMYFSLSHDQYNAGVFKTVNLKVKHVKSAIKCARKSKYVRMSSGKFIVSKRVQGCPSYFLRQHLDFLWYPLTSRSILLYSLHIYLMIYRLNFISSLLPKN